MASDSSDSDERAEGRVARALMQRLFSGVGGEYGDAENDDASARSETPRPSQSQSQSPREHFVLKLKAKADGQMESRLEKRRSPHDTSANVMMDFIARLRQTVEKLPRERGGAGATAAAAADAARRREAAERRRDACATTATVSREQYLRLEEKYIELDEKYKDIQEKYYWLEKEAQIVVKMLTERGDVAAPAPTAAPAPAAATGTHDNDDPVEEEAPSSRPGLGAAQGVQLAPGVCLSRAQWQALQTVQAATHSRALVRKLALILFGRRALLQYQDLKPELMEFLQDKLHQRQVDGGFSEETARQLTPAAAPRYLQKYRAQLRMQAKRQRVRASEVGVGTTCGECNKRFRSRSHLHAHARVHSGVRPYSCSECGATFMFHTQFNQHARAHAHGSARARVCPRCGDAFPQLAHLHWHARRAHGAAPPAHARRHKAVKPHPEWLRVPLRDADDLTY